MRAQRGRSQHGRDGRSPRAGAHHARRGRSAGGGDGPQRRIRQAGAHLPQPLPGARAPSPQPAARPQLLFHFGRRRHHHHRGRGLQPSGLRAGPKRCPGRPRALLGQGAGGAHPFASRPHGQPRPHLARGHAGAREPALLPRGEEPHGDGGQRLWSAAPSSGHFRAAARHDLRRGGAAFARVGGASAAFHLPDHDVSGRWRLPESRRVRVRGDRDAGPRSLAHLPLRGRPQDPPVRRSCSGAHHAVGIVVVFCLQRIGGVPG